MDWGWGGGYDACGSRMESIKLSATSVLWKKIQLDFFRALNNKGANPRRTQVFCCCCIYIFKKKLLWHSVPWVWVGCSCPRGICTMKTRLDGSRRTSHAHHLYMYIIYYAKTVMNEYSVYTPPPWFCSKWIIKWNTQPRVVRSTFDMVHWFFSAFFWILIIKTQTISRL